MATPTHQKAAAVRAFTATVAAVAIACVALVTIACNRPEQQPPAAQTQAQTPVQSMSVPESVTGCLRAGEAPEAFVLTTGQAAEGTHPVTYQLIGANGVNLLDHVGKRVTVSGIVREQQATTTATAPTAATEKPKGTSGTPTVQTSATLQMRRMEVQTISRAGGDCEK